MRGWGIPQLGPSEPGVGEEMERGSEAIKIRRMGLEGSAGGPEVGKNVQTDGFLEDFMNFRGKNWLKSPKFTHVQLSFLTVFLKKARFILIFTGGPGNSNRFDRGTWIKLRHSFSQMSKPDPFCSMGSECPSKICKKLRMCRFPIHKHNVPSIPFSKSNTHHDQKSAKTKCEETKLSRLI